MNAIEHIEEQLKTLKTSELKAVCRVLRQKKPIKYSKLQKGDMIREITNFLDFSEAFDPVTKRLRKRNPETVAKRMNELVEIVCLKRLRCEDTKREQEEYRKLRNELIFH
jgi:hypothetical protein